MTMVNDDLFAVTLEPVIGLVRMTKYIPQEGEDKPDYCAVGTVTHMSGNVAKLSGFSGCMTRRHMRLLCHLLLRQGYDIVYVERALGHTLPHGDMIAAGDWEGHWRVLLHEVHGRRRTDPKLEPAPGDDDDSTEL